MKRGIFIILCLEGVVLSFNVAACAALVPSIAKDFALSQFLVGRVIWLYMLPYGIAALFYGPLARTVDAKRIEFVSLFLFSCANLLAAVSRDIHLLFAARFLMGVFGASVIPLAIILIGKHIDKQIRGRFIGFFFSATFFASLVGLFLSGLIHWRFIFLIPALCGFLLTAVIYFYLPSLKEDSRSLKINYFVALKNRKVLSIFTYIFLISLFYHGVQQWLGVYFSQDFAFSQLVISMLITLTSLSGIFGEAFGGILADMIGRIKTLNLGITLMILVIFLLMFKLPVLILAWLMILWGLGWTFNHAGLSTILTDLPEEHLNEAASLNSSVRFISGGVGVAIGGFFMQRNFMVGFIIFGLSLILLLLFNRPLLVE